MTPPTVRWNEPIIDALVSGAVTKLLEKGVKQSNIGISDCNWEFSFGLFKVLYQSLIIFYNKLLNRTMLPSFRVVLLTNREIVSERPDDTLVFAACHGFSVWQNRVTRRP